MKSGMSTRELERHIQEQIHLDLNSASFKKTDDTLTPAGPCTICTKRTGFLPELFPDIKKKDTCTDPDCFHAKVEAFLKRRTDELKKDTPDLLILSTHYEGYRGLNDLRTKKGPDAAISENLYKIVGKRDETCESQQKGILVDGKEAGKVLTVCVDSKCKVHHVGRWSAPMTPKERAAKKGQIEKEKIETAIREKILDATVSAWPADPGRDDWGFLAGEFFRELWHEYRKKLLARHELKPIKQQYGHDYEKPMMDWIGKASKADLIRVIFEMALTRNIQRSFNRERDALMDQAKRKIDVKKIEAEVRAEFKEKKEKKIKKPKKGKKKKAKKSTAPQEGTCQYCGCTEGAPCIRVGANESCVTCGWANKEKTICTFCAEKHPVEGKPKRKRPK
jgi:ParB family chromosome partitioning protein